MAKNRLNKFLYDTADNALMGVSMLPIPVRAIPTGASALRAGLHAWDAATDPDVDFSVERTLADIADIPLTFIGAGGADDVYKGAKQISKGYDIDQAIKAQRIDAVKKQAREQDIMREGFTEVGEHLPKTYDPRRYARAKDYGNTDTYRLAAVLRQGGLTAREADDMAVKQYSEWLATGSASPALQAILTGESSAKRMGELLRPITQDMTAIDEAERMYDAGRSAVKSGLKKYIPITAGKFAVNSFGEGD